MQLTHTHNNCYHVYNIMQVLHSNISRKYNNYYLASSCFIIILIIINMCSFIKYIHFQETKKIILLKSLQTVVNFTQLTVSLFFENNHNIENMIGWLETSMTKTYIILQDNFV